ncbi:MAG: 50S ribosomal protein L29 [Deltaproteobacteria bacterium]|uniref:Large ribosomal subunit protein uL29 n=1 Tax=Candidatus Zymogenus saltonus TaxID=2844893 RepID=A0A9D8KGM0_9DELT|nr:50S ribosomal protein L29 [Candidatus Zymogenus saltonus]
MKASDLRDLSVEELMDREETLSQELFNLRFQRAANQLENKMKIRLTKRDRARVLTVIKEKMLEEERKKGDGD